MHWNLVREDADRAMQNINVVTFWSSQWRLSPPSGLFLPFESSDSTCAEQKNTMSGSYSGRD
jgi:hypothetical protein